VLDEDDSLKLPSELFPEAFAKEFLLPASGVQKRFAERCRVGTFTPVDLYVLARAFGVSFHAMAVRLEELRLLPRGSYEKIVRSRLRPQDLGEHAEPQPRRAAAKLGLPERYIALAMSAYDQEHFSEREFAECLGTDIATARAVYQDNNQIALEDGTRLTLDLSGVLPITSGRRPQTIPT
jgi:hypothetical protein